ncbi:MAG: zinc ribbon domain-containing protein [Kiritimatiellae bacterium]|nr:zinc ribbon domain-containing protein [Kiritimatiellia bacterium]
MSTPADNPMILVCKKCGEKNRLPCVHCRKCGAKLDFDAAEATLQEAARGRGSAGRTVRSLVLLALVAVLALALWPSGLPRRTTGAPVDAKRAEMKRDLMADALERGFPSAQTFTEAELNAWLAKLPAAQEERGGMAAQLLDTAVEFGENRAQWLVLVKRGPFRISVVFEAKADGAHLVPTGARMGHLPLPGAVGRLYIRSQGRLFRPFAKEGRILGHLESLVIRDGEIELLTRTE